MPFNIQKTKKKAAECNICTDKLTKTEKLFQLMVNNIKDYAIIHLDAEGCVATWNSGAQYIKGYTEEDVIGKPISIFYTPEEIAAGKPKRDLQLALQHGRFETEGLCVKKDGSTFYANIVYTAIVDGQGLHKALATSVAGLDSVIKDINKTLQIKNELKEKKEIIFFSKLVSDIVDSIGNLIDKDNVQINPDFSAVDEIFSIKAYFHSIFFNLITNSIKYAKPGETAQIEIKSKTENGKIILTFKDNGIGIDLNRNGGKVFGLYERFHAHVEGKGIGLFMVKTQVEAIGGKISIESEPNKGTEFTITIKK